MKNLASYIVYQGALPVFTNNNKEKVRKFIQANYPGGYFLNGQYYSSHGVFVWKNKD